MKKIKTEIDDWGRSEYERSDLGELVRGKYANTQLEFSQLVHLLLVCIGEDEGIRFEHHSVGNYMAQHRAGDWTYEIDNSNQITLRYWLSEHANAEELISNPPVITKPAERAELQELLLNHVGALREKVARQNPSS
jgi:hypothetical protein